MRGSVAGPAYNPAVVQLIANGGPFVGQWKAQSRVTVEPGFWLNQSSGPVGNRPPAKLPIRWYQREDMDDTFNPQIEIEIPNIKSVQIQRDMTQKAGSVTVEIYNTNIPANGQRGEVVPAPGFALGEPGFFSFSHGSTKEAQTRWGQLKNAWQDVLRENALLRVWQGYGGYHPDGTRMSIPEAVAGGYMILTGVFLLDDPAIESNGITKLNGRDMAKLLIDQQTVPPLIPQGKYPINYYGPNQAFQSFAATPGYGVGAWAEQRGVYHDSSQAAVNGAAEAALAASNAFDGNVATAWISEVKGSTADHVWIELDVQEEITGVYLYPWGGNYNCYVSVLVNGQWQGTGNIGGIPYVLQFGTGFETGRWSLFQRRYLASRVRFTFTNLVHSYGGQIVAGMREIKVGSTGIVTRGEMDVLDMDVTPSGNGYRIFGADGGVFCYGDSVFKGSLAGTALNAGIVGGQGTPTNQGYWLCAADGGVFTFGDAGFYGTPVLTADGHFTISWLPGYVKRDPLQQPIVSFRSTPSGRGYWMCAADGGVFAYGDAGFYGSRGALPPDQQINVVDMAIRPQGDGYWLLGEDGSIYAFGAANYLGGANNDSYPGALFVGIDSTPSGNGYIITTDTGTVVTYGDAIYEGSEFDQLQAPISGIRRRDAYGYWLVAQDGGIFAYGDAPFLGSLPGAFQLTLAPDYTDYADIIKDLALYAGFWLYPPGGAVPAGSAPNVYGIIETTGAYNSLGPMGIQFFDKRPVIDVMADIANIVGYIVRVDETGGLHFEAPNIWGIGNFWDDNTPTATLPVIDERINLSDFIMTQSDQDLRSPIVVAVMDPYQYGGATPGTNTTTFLPPYTPLLKGIQKSAMYATPLQVAAKDQQYFAELIALRIWLQSRSGAVTAWCNPMISVDDQVRIYERNTGETQVHYVHALSTNHDLVTGKWEMQLTTYWMGGNDTGWVITGDFQTLNPGIPPQTYYTPVDPNSLSFLMTPALTSQLVNNGGVAVNPLRSAATIGAVVTI